MAVIDQILRSYGIHKSRPDPMFPPLTPEEESSVLEDLGDAGLRGLSYVGSTLDKTFGGRALRGWLGGKNQEIKSLIPFSDALGITDESNSVTGRDLGEKWGWIGPNQEGLDWGDVGGAGIEAVLDPSNFLSFGGAALTKSGRAAAKAGTLGKTVAERIAKGQGGHLGVGLPFMDNFATFDLRPLGRVSAAIGGALASPVTGPAKMAYNYLDKAAGGGISKGLGAAGRSLNSLFNTNVAEQVDPISQGLAPSVLERREARNIPQRETLAQVSRLIGPAGASSRELAYLVEERALRAAGDPDALAAWRAASPEMRQAADLISADQAAKLAEAKGAGRRTEELKSMWGTEHFPRQIAKATEAEDEFWGPAARHPLEPVTESDRQRQKILDVRGGSRGLERIVADPRVSTKARTQTNKALIKKILHDDYEVVNPEFKRLEEASQKKAGGMGPFQRVEDFADDLLQKQASGAQLSPEELELINVWNVHKADPYRHAGELGDYLGTLDKSRLPSAHGGQDIGLFGRSPLADLETYDVQHAKSMAAAEIGIETMAKAASPARMNPGDRTVRQTLLAMGLKADKNLQMLGSRLDEFIPADMAESLVNGARAFTMPDQAKGAVKLIRDMTDWFKKGVTSPFPAFHVRNWVSAIWSNMTNGTMPLSSSYREARNILKDGIKPIPGISKTAAFAGSGMNDLQATIALADGAFARRITGANFMDLSGAAADTGEDIVRRIPGLTKREGVLGSIKKGFKEGNEGALGLAKGAVGAGREVGNYVEDSMRFAGFIDLVKKGYAMDVAAAKVRAAHVDYSKLTSFERQVMRPLIPFYTFSRQNIPHQLRQLMENPGSLTGQAIKGAANVREEAGGGFMPEYLGQGAAIPIGARQDDSNQLFLTQLGLPFEQPFDVLDPSSGMRTLERLGSQLNPLAKAPLEYISNKQLYSGRELDKAYSMFGDSDLGRAGTQLIMNSPIARMATTIQGLLDSRKEPLTRAINAGTGFKFSTQDMDKQSDLAARDILKRVLADTQGVKSLNKFYVPKEELANLSQEEIILMRLARTFEQRARERAEEKAKSGR